MIKKHAFIITLLAANVGAVFATDSNNIAEQKVAIQQYLADQQALASSKQALQKSLSEQNFNTEKRQAYPLTPAQIKELRELNYQKSQAANAPLTHVAAENQSVNFKNKAINVNLAPNYVSVVQFYDATGNPYPIQVFSSGSKLINIESPKGANNTLLVKTSTSFVRSNIQVMLVGFPSPVNLLINGSDSITNPQVSIRMNSLSPTSQENLSSNSAYTSLPNSVSQVQMDFLNGTPPQSAKKLPITLEGAEAWRYNKHLFLRMKPTLLSPPYLSSLSISGLHLYVIDSSSHNLLVANNGKMVPITIGENNE